MALGKGTRTLAFGALALLAPLALRAQSFCEAVAPETLVSPIVLGNGSPGSVTTAQIQAALTTGGHIRFNVGTSPTTIVVTSTLTINHNVVVDGAGVVTLSGGNARRIVQIAPQPAAGYSVTFQNISFANANVPAGRGGAIFNQSGGFWQVGSLKLVNCGFDHNAAMATGQDDGGGAAYLTGLARVDIGNCTFTSNSGSNGGAVYTLGTLRVNIVDALFQANLASGTGGNPGNGGNAGALGVDGAERLVDVCRTRFVANNSNAYGAGFFSVMYDNISRTRFEDVTFDSNRVLSTDRFAAGAYVQDGPFAMERVSFINNDAPGNSGLFVTGSLAAGTIRNSTFSRNVARTGLGAAMSIGSNSPVSIVNTTIANNVSTAAFAAGISIGTPNQLRLTNVILANNSGGNRFVNWGIQNAAAQDGGGNMQWPMTRPNGGGNETRATPTTSWANALVALYAVNNGGYVPTLGLDQASPARDTGVVTGEVPPADARGVARVGATDRGSYEVTPLPAVTDPAVVYRLRHPTLGAYLYSVYPAERDAAQWQYGYVYEGTCCTWIISPGAGRIPLFRLFSGSAGEYFFTSSTAERDAAVAQFGYVYEGISAYCHPSSDPEATHPWFRLRLGNKHFYTIYPSERDTAVQQYGYVYEGVACYQP